MSRNAGFRIFFVIWFGQLISLLGTNMTRFALLIWAYQQTESATTVALLGFFTYTPYVLASPIAGVWIDRLDRRLVMLGSDLGAGLMTIGLLLLFRSGNLAIWHMYLAAGLTGVFDAFQRPAYSAAITMLLPKSEFARASGLRSFGTNFSQIFGPVLAGVFLVIVDIDGVMLIDVATFLAAMVTLLFVRVPNPEKTEGVGPAADSIYESFRFGLRFILARRGLWQLQIIFTGINFFAALTYFGIMPALVLARTGGDEIALASVQTALGVGGVVGAFILSLWGGPKRHVHGVLVASAISFWLGDLLFATGRSTWVWVIGAFAASFFVPFIVGSFAAIWQSKVPPAIQGRVLAVQDMIGTASFALGFLLAGPLADWIFEPAMQPGGVLVDTFSWLVGSGKGAGMGVMFLGTAIGGTLVSLSGYLLPAVRHVETNIPDFDESVAAELSA